MEEGDRFVLRSGNATASVARHGAELTSWRVGGRELMWSADPKYWGRSAPILFPVVGASAGGEVVVSGKSFAMPQHGFARDSDFEVIDCTGNSVLLRLTDNETTRSRYPFSFSVTVQYRLTDEGLAIAFDVANKGSDAMPYQLGFHPAFVWPFLSAHKDGHELVFASVDARAIYRPNRQGLMHRTSNAATPGGRLALTSDMFEEGALVFPDAQSPTVRMTSPSGARLDIAVDGFPHWALWTKLGAPFVSIEQWTGLPDWEDVQGELADRPSAIFAKAGERYHHAIRMRAQV